MEIKISKKEWEKVRRIVRLEIASMFFKIMKYLDKECEEDVKAQIID